MAVGCASRRRQPSAAVARVRARLPPDADRARRRERRPADVQPRRQGAPRAAIPDHAQQRDRVVGRLADLRLRRDLTPAREARPRRSRRSSCWSPLGQRAGAGERQGYLPLLEPSDPMPRSGPARRPPRFPDNWIIGMSFYHNVFAREHNLFVDDFRATGGARRPTPTPGCATPPGRPRSSAIATSPPTSCSRSRGSWSRRRSPRSTRSSGRRSCSTTSRCTAA